MQFTKQDIKFIVLIILVLIGKFLSAQDSFFSNHHSTSMYNNPINTGISQNDWRFINNYRCQWKSFGQPYNSYFTSYDRQFYLYNENISSGIFIIRETSGSNNFFSNNITASLAYHKEIKNNTYHIGIQGGYLQKGIDTKNLTLPDQFDMSSGYFNPEFSTEDNIIRSKMSAYIFNFGLGFSKHFNGKEITIGYSYNNFKIPVSSFINLDYSLYNKNTIFIESKIGLGTKVYLTPSVYSLTQHASNQVTLGTSIGYIYKYDQLKDYDISCGVYLRTGKLKFNESLIFSAGVEVSNFLLGINYDIGISKIARMVGLKNALELSFIWKGIYSNIDKTKNKCVRF
ncbi:MAG: hypothetical protein A2046_06055 [Bacteroidetes bacterium GWA2_30_7]|nr:MAG: hypothetical protein A2046_06055 [Bacteroidetes bacterium GWA2_30_7]